jgi:hypothetical protein
MLRILQQFILATLLSAIASAPSYAMFIQPDWLDPTNPGVGTNDIHTASMILLIYLIL